MGGRGSSSGLSNGSGISRVGKKKEVKMRWNQPYPFDIQMGNVIFQNRIIRKIM